MPMKNLSTQRMNKIMEKGETLDIREAKPRRQTLSFLNQFARVYNVEPAVHQDFCGFVIN
jgi:hypothetical protein